MNKIFDVFNKVLLGAYFVIILACFVFILFLIPYAVIEHICYSFTLDFPLWLHLLLTGAVGFLSMIYWICFIDVSLRGD